MDEVAVAASVAGAFVVLATFRLSKVSNRAVFSMHLLVIVVLSTLILKTRLRLLFSCKFDVYVAHHVVADVVDHQHIQYLPILAKFDKYFFEKVFEVFGSF